MVCGPRIMMPSIRAWPPMEVRNSLGMGSPFLIRYKMQRHGSDRLMQVFLAGAVDRQRDADRRALPQRRGDLHHAAQRAHDLVDEGQADAGPAHGVARLEKFLLDFAQVVGRNAAALRSEEHTSEL